MSHYDYAESERVKAEARPFYALIMAAMRQADTINLAKLQNAWPDVWAELEERYNAPGGILPEEMAMRRPPFQGAKICPNCEEPGDPGHHMMPGIGYVCYP